MLKHNSLDTQIPLQPDYDEQWLLPDADSNQPHQEMPESLDADTPPESSVHLYITHLTIIDYCVFVLGGGMLYAYK